MKYIFLSVFLAFTNLSAQTLKEILELQKQDNKTKSIEAMRDAKIAQSRLYSSYEAPRLAASVADAKELTQEGLEYTVAFSQNIDNPFDIQEKSRVSENFSKSAALEGLHLLHVRELDIAAKYYSACSAKALHREALRVLDEHKKSLQRVSEAHKLGEISKKSLLFHKLELAKSHQNAREYARLYREAFGTLQESVASQTLKDVACSDTLEPKRDLVLKSLNAHAELQRLEYEQNAASAQERLYDSAVQNIGYELMYEDELATQRYRFGINIPITALGSQNRALHESALKRRLSLGYAKEALREELRSAIEKQKERVEALYEEYELVRDEVVPLSKELLELAEYAYQEGEGTTLEYLEASRSFAKSTLELLEVKKLYYEELFELYKLTDTHFGEEICTK